MTSANDDDGALRANPTNSPPPPTTEDVSQLGEEEERYLPTVGPSLYDAHEVGGHVDAGGGGEGGGMGGMGGSSLSVKETELVNHLGRLQFVRFISLSAHVSPQATSLSVSLFL